MQLNAEQLTERYEALTMRAVAQCTFTTEVVGGAPATREGIEAFVTHHLKLEGDEAASAIDRIIREESGQDIAGPEDELQEKLTFGLTGFRKDPEGRAWLGNWQIKACLKQAASRLGLFMKKKGAKGDLAELGSVAAYGKSALGPPRRIYLINGDGAATATYFQRFMGRVTGPQGSVSIVRDCECAPEGTRFAFELRVGRGRFTVEDIANIFACSMVVGLGSGKAFEAGKFRIDNLIIEETGRDDDGK